MSGKVLDLPTAVSLRFVVGVEAPKHVPGCCVQVCHIQVTVEAEVQSLSPCNLFKTTRPGPISPHPIY